MNSFVKNTSLAGQINKQLAMTVGGLLVVGVIYVQFMLGSAVNKSDLQLTNDLQTQILGSEDGKKNVALGIAVTVASNSQIANALENNDRGSAIDALNNLGKSWLNEKNGLLKT